MVDGQCHPEETWQKDGTYNGEGEVGSQSATCLKG